MSKQKQIIAVSSRPNFALNPLSHWVTSLALVSCLASTHVIAQETAGETPNDAPQSVVEKKKDTDIDIIEVIGTRASQESAIERKKHAKTAVDSIIAEDVGTLPDRNVGEAISRIAGIALDRGDMGEGVAITVRGNSPDLTRVEIDGQAVQSGGGSAAPMNGDISQGGTGRGQGMRDLPSDLIKSVDVIKGSTADMNEGALGGGVLIKTRSSLDFKKRYTSIRAAVSQGSINTDVSPNFNLIFADKFLEDRVGVLVNASSSKLSNEGHTVALTDNSRGYAHLVDFDNSPEKTFSFNPATVSTVDALATTPLLSSPLTAGGTLDFDTPLSFVTKAGAAQTKADCEAAFPALTATQTNAINTPANRTLALGQRSNELQSCLNQWNDWTPTNIRNIVRRDVEERQSVDLRFDFKVTDELTLYAKGSESTRDIENSFETYSLGGGLSVNPATISIPGFSGNPADDTSGKRNARKESGYYTIENNSSFSNTGYSIPNAVVNIDPASVEVDANHHVTKYNYSNAVATTDQIDSDIDSKSRYFQIGGTYEKDRILAEFMIGDATSDFIRKDLRTNWGAFYGSGTLTAQKNGLWTYSLPAGSSFDQTDPSLYAKINPSLQAASVAVAASPTGPAIPAYTAVQKPLLSYAQPPLQASAFRINETQEKTAKVDVTYKFEDQLPYITSIKSGLNYRETSGAGWGNGGATIKAAVGTFGQPGYQSAVILPNINIRANLIGCQDTPGSLGAGGQPCAYGYTQFANPANALGGNVVVTQERLQDIIAQSMKAPSAEFFNGLPGRGNQFVNAWNQIDVKKFYDLVGAPNFNLDCIKRCTASDGNVYDQPFSSFSEETLAGYVMADFEFKELPLGMEIDANAGVRVVENEINATGYPTLTSVVKIPGVYDPLNPGAAAGVTSSTIQDRVDIARETRDVLPSFNIGLWALPEELVIRYSRGRTVARPAVPQLLPAGTCVFDERTRDFVNDSDGSSADMRCSGNFGNPALKAQSNINQNLSVEWYPSKGYMLSAAIFRQASKVGGARTVTLNNVRPFAGSDVIDPQTNIALAEVDYTLNTYINGPGIDRKGMEFAAKAAFTFLPWKFQYLGLDINSSVLESSDSLTLRELNTGKALPPTGESDYAYNIALWYDDGHLTARIAYQARGESLVGLTGGGAGSSGNRFNYPADGVFAPQFPYNPSGPIFKDSTAFIDAKIAYQFDSGLDIFLEGRNLGRATNTTSSGGYYDFANGAPYINEYSYYGRRFMAGINYKF